MPTPVVGVMRKALFALIIILNGCASMHSPESPTQQALNSCFMSDDQEGWSVLAAPPINAEELKSLALSQRAHGSIIDNHHKQFWFSHADGRLLFCELFPVGNFPPVCGSITSEFTRTANGWATKNGNILICDQLRH